MAIQYSISYDDKGNPSLTKNTIEGPKEVVKTSFNIGKFEPKRTISDFANVSSFDDIVAERGTVNKSLQNYIYQNNTNTDGSKDVEQNKTFSAQSFEAAVARGPDGKVLGSPLTFKERMKMAAVQSYISSKQPTIGSTIFGGILSKIPGATTVNKIMSYAGSKFVDPYYDPIHSDYYFSGYGMYDDTTKALKSRDDRLSRSGGVKMGITSSSTVYGTDYGYEIEKEFNDKQNEIGKALHGDNGNTGSMSNEQASTNREGRRGGQYDGGGNGGNQGGGDLSGTEGSF